MAEKIIEMPIEEILPTSFMEYAREVIEGRALPDVRDGLKPVHRRILYSMNDLGITDKEPHRKSARIVGDVLGKYHPHGDSSVYDAMVRLAQDFSMRYPLVDGHGNFGSIDGDSAAAMRYTEARMKSVAVEMLRDIDKDTIEWQNNFDDTLKEPVCLPSFFPNLMVNGTSGIAVGMASSIPPHNLTETVDAINAYIENPNIDTTGLMDYVKGPDFPTGGIVSPDGLFKAYETGEGKVKVRAKVNIEELPNDKRQLVITEIPYQANKTKLKEKMADYIEARAIKDVVEVRDESDKDGIRIIVEMAKGGDAKKLLQELYAKTPLEDSFTYIMIALVNGKPRTLSLKCLIEEYVKHKKEIVEKRSNFQLAKAKKREHILLGLIKAVDIIDDIIKVIRHSKSPKEAKENLMKEFDFSGEQAQAILELKLQRLTALEINALNKELAEVQSEINKLEKILSSEANILKEVQKELKVIRDNYGDARRTLVADFSTLKIEESSEKFTLQIDGKKVIKRAENYKGEKGVILKSDSTQNILMFTKKGKILKYTGINLPPQVDDDIVSACNKSDYGEDTYAIFITSDGQIKKTLLSEYYDIKTNSIALKLNENAHVVDVYFESDSGGEDDNNSDNIAENNKNIVLFTKTGYVIRIKIDDIRPVGRIAGGIKAISLAQHDKIAASIIINQDISDIEINVEFSEKEGSDQASIKQKARAVLKLKNVKIQNRGGKGTQLLKDLIVLNVW